MKNQNNTTKACPKTVGWRALLVHYFGNISKYQNQRGITLIALVITIIILLILAGVVLNLTLGEHGILKKAEQGVEQYRISEILEKLELEKADLYARKNGQTPTLQEYIDHLINKGIITPSDVTDVDDSTKNIVIDGYVFTIIEESGNIKTTYQGKDTKEPRIASLKIIGTTIDSISVKVIASNTDGASYKYSIKNITTGETEFTLVTTLNTNEYTFTGLTINNDYIIQVELITSEGTDTKETGTIKTEPPKVTSITLDKTNIELTKGGTDTIIASILPENAGDKTLTWTSSNEAVVTVDDSGNITAIGEGVAIITVTSNEVNSVTASCNITVTLPPPPTVGAGGETHTAKQIQYTWEELSQIAKVISDNYGTEVGQVNNNTAEVNVSINGKADTLGIGDYTTVNGERVRILGFNHDELADQTIYGGTNAYAGISFEYAKFFTTTARMNASNTSANGWGACELRSTLNNITINSLENKEYIKQVNKQYIKTYNNAGSVTTSNDKLWLLSCSEIWNNGYQSGAYGYAVTKEGEQYKYYRVINANATSKASALIKNPQLGWWLRSTSYRTSTKFSCVAADGSGYDSDAVRSSSSKIGVAPGFAI